MPDIPGVNTVEIRVTVPGCANPSKVYTLTVTRVVPLSSNANLAWLTTSAGLLIPPFHPSTATYTLGVANDVSSITVTPTVEDPAAAVLVNGRPVQSGTESDPVALEVGVSAIAIEVFAENGDTRTYTVTVTRAAPADDAYEGNNTLATAYDLSNREETLLSALSGLGIVGDHDWYRIEVSPGEEEIHIVCTFPHDGGDIDKTLHDSGH